MSDAIGAAREEWDGARRAAQAVLREPGGLPVREQALLRVSVLPQIEAALATLDEGGTAAELARWHAFLPGAIECLAGESGLDPGLETARDHMRRGLAALGG